jgi:hypothetical protein
VADRFDFSESSPTARRVNGICALALEWMLKPVQRRETQNAQFFGIAAALITTIAAGAVANDALPLSMIGHHLRIQSLAAHLQPCAALKCPNYHDYNFIDPGTGYTILGFTQNKGDVFVNVRLDDGRTGFLWELTPQNLASQEKAQNACQNKQPARIGMTEDDVLKSQWGQPWSHNTTETAAGTREQSVYENGPHCTADGLPNPYGNLGYLYFDNGRLVAIQR